MHIVAAGIEVIGTGGTERGRMLAVEQGTHHVLDHHAPNYLDQIQPLTLGHGVDVILEMLANVNLDKDLKTLAMGGRIVVIGSRGRVEIDPRDAMMQDASDSRHAPIRRRRLRNHSPFTPPFSRD